MLKTVNLCKNFIRKNNSFSAVDHVSLSVHAGEMVVLTGPSGCGKSTFFHLLSGITPADSGQILFENQDITKLNQKEFAKLRAEKISYILQGESLLSNFTVLENICLPHQLHSHKLDLKQQALDLLEQFGLSDMSDELPSNLSGGERRRVAIARAFVHDPMFIIADEPTSDLDEENSAMIMEFFQQQAKNGKAVLISTHDLAAIPSQITHYTMNHGCIRKK